MKRYWILASGLRLAESLRLGEILDKKDSSIQHPASQSLVGLSASGGFVRRETDQEGGASLVDLIAFPFLRAAKPRYIKSCNDFIKGYYFIIWRNLFQCGHDQ